jgi:hypothetical protein
MRTLFYAMIVVVVAGPAWAERRCGWYHNPTPANVILEDADGQWWISQQGSAPAPGFEDAYTNAFDDRVRFRSDGQIITSGPGYGYSCACVDGVFDANAPLYENVLSVSRLTELPVARCESDPKLSAKPDY